MAKKQGGLGRDFYSLLDDNIIESKQDAITSLRMAVIQPRKDQPRKDFDMGSLQTLADSVREHGIIQPILVREMAGDAGRYEIVAGERRYRAAEIAGLDEVPVVVMTGDDLEVAKVSLIENVQRKDLNPVEEALAYRTLMDRFYLTQEQVATQAGKNRSTVANMLRLLELPEKILLLLREGSLSMGHARALLGLSDTEEAVRLAERTVEKELSVREVERLVRLINQRLEEASQPEEPQSLDQHAVYMKDLENRLMTRMGRKVKIRQSGRKKIVELSFEDDKDLEELLLRLGGQDLFD